MSESSNRAQMPMSASMAVTLVVGLMIFGVLSAVMLPVAINQIEGDDFTTINQTTSTTYEVNSKLNSTVTAVTAGTDATIELNDTRTSGTTSKTINVGDNATYSLDGGDVEVGVEEAQSGYAIGNYTYATDYSFSDSASSLWGLLGLAIVLAAMLFAVAIAMRFT